jgi:hypothetical protein
MIVDTPWLRRFEAEYQSDLAADLAIARAISGLPPA